MRIIEAKPVKQVAQEKSQWQRSADHGRTVNYTVESKVLQTANYKDWFHNLLSLEERHASQQLKQTRYFVILTYLPCICSPFTVLLWARTHLLAVHNLLSCITGCPFRKVVLCCVHLHVHCFQKLLHPHEPLQRYRNLGNFRS